MMKPLSSLAAVLAATMLGGCATSQPDTSSEGVALKREESSIPFFNRQRAAVSGWQADGTQGLWVEGAQNDWYYARFINPCIGLGNAVRLGFDTGTSDRLDKFARVIVPDEPTDCAIGSFTKSDPPPEGKRRSLATEEVR